MAEPAKPRWPATKILLDGVSEGSSVILLLPLLLATQFSAQGLRQARDHLFHRRGHFLGGKRAIRRAKRHRDSHAPAAFVDALAREYVDALYRFQIGPGGGADRLLNRRIRHVSFDYKGQVAI